MVSAAKSGRCGHLCTDTVCGCGKTFFSDCSDGEVLRDCELPGSFYESGVPGGGQKYVEICGRRSSVAASDLTCDLTGIKWM